MEENQIHCPKCNSTQITANKKGFSAGKAVAGAILTGGIGLAAGAIGSGKVVITCLACGHQFKPGSGKKNTQIEVQAKPKVDDDSEVKTIKDSIEIQGVSKTAISLAASKGISLSDATSQVLDVKMKTKAVAPEDSKNAGKCLFIILIVVLALILYMLS